MPTQRPPAIIANDMLDQQTVDEHIANLNKAKTFILQYRFDAALKELKEIDKSPVRQVRVRTKFHLADILSSSLNMTLRCRFMKKLFATMPLVVSF